MHFLPHALSSLKLPLFDASAPSFDDPACFRKALRTLFVHTDRTVVSPFCTSNVIRSVRSSHLLSSSEIVRPSSARVSARSLIGSPRCDFTFIRKVALPARTRCVSTQIISRRISALLQGLVGMIRGLATPRSVGVRKKGILIPPTLSGV